MLQRDELMSQSVYIGKIAAIGYFLSATSFVKTQATYKRSYDSYVYVILVAVSFIVSQGDLSYAYDRDQLYLKSCRSTQTFSTRRNYAEITTSCRQFYRIAMATYASLNTL